jgi:hypothetical protein
VQAEFFNLFVFENHGGRVRLFILSVPIHHYFGINDFGLCNCVESIDAYDHILWLGSLSSEYKGFQRMLEKPYCFFGILKFAAKQVLSAVEEAHARTWLTDMEI